MKKLDNFSNCLAILKDADFKLAGTNDIYRTGIIGQFNLTFELSWKALQETMKLHGVAEAATGSPREILQLGYKIGFINDSAVWLLMPVRHKPLSRLTGCERLIRIIVPPVPLFSATRTVGSPLYSIRGREEVSLSADVSSQLPQLPITHYI